MVIERGVTIENPDPAFGAEVRRIAQRFDDEVARCGRGKAWRAASGFDEALAAQTAALTAADEAGEVMLATVPTSMAGLSALFEYLSVDTYGLELPDDWERTAMATAAASLRRFMLAAGLSATAVL
jgi:hypothetical protein